MAGHAATDQQETKPRSTGSVLILGHSFVRRLQKYLVETEGDNSLQLCQFNSIRFCGLSGAVVSDLWSKLALVREVTPDIVLLEIGSNDLCDQNVSPRKFVTELQEFVQTLVTSCCVKRVIISQIFYRGPGYHPRRNQRNLKAYNLTVFNTNQKLQQTFYQSRRHRSVIYYRHRGIWKDFHQYLLADGVHLNPVGNKKLKTSYRKALILAGREININNP